VHAVITAGPLRRRGIAVATNARQAFRSSPPFHYYWLLCVSDSRTVRTGEANGENTSACLIDQVVVFSQTSQFEPLMIVIHSSYFHYRLQNCPTGSVDSRCSADRMEFLRPLGRGKKALVRLGRLMIGADRIECRIDESPLT